MWTRLSCGPMSCGCWCGVSCAAKRENHGNKKETVNVALKVWKRLTVGDMKATTQYCQRGDLSRFEHLEVCLEACDRCPAGLLSTPWESCGPATCNVDSMWCNQRWSRCHKKFVLSQSQNGPKPVTNESIDILHSSHL